MALKRGLILAILGTLGMVNNIVAATGSLNGLPILNGPINTVQQIKGMKKSPGDFVHPGLWHTHDDLERIRLGVEDGKEPWKSSYANFSADPYSQADVSVWNTPYLSCCVCLIRLTLESSMS